MLAERNLGREDRLKALQHQLACLRPIIIAKISEQEVWRCSCSGWKCSWLQLGHIAEKKETDFSINRRCTPGSHASMCTSPVAARKPAPPHRWESFPTPAPTIPTVEIPSAVWPHVTRLHFSHPLVIDASAASTSVVGCGDSERYMKIRVWTRRGSLRSALRGDDERLRGTEVKDSSTDEYDQAPWYFKVSHAHALESNTVL